MKASSFYHVLSPSSHLISANMYTLRWFVTLLGFCLFSSFLFQIFMKNKNYFYIRLIFFFLHFSIGELEAIMDFLDFLDKHHISDLKPIESYCSFTIFSNDCWLNESKLEKNEARYIGQTQPGIKPRSQDYRSSMLITILPRPTVILVFNKFV